MNKDFLGDSVYVEFDGGAYTLIKADGYGPTNIIVLEPQMLAALERFVARRQADARARRLIQPHR